jgi:UDP-3-O-[3-hydroxymyristoyl] glucosamine N-acyltransferase
MPKLSVALLAKKLGADIIGDGNLAIERVVHPADATGDSDLVVAFDKALHPLLAGSRAKAVVLAVGQENLAETFQACLLVKRPRYAMAELTALFAHNQASSEGIHPSAVIDPSAKIGAHVSIGPLCYIGPRAEIGDGTTFISQVTIGADAKIGANCLFHAGARIGDRVEVGDRCIIHYNSVIGSDGFSFVTPEAGSVETAKASQGGTVQAFNTQIVRIHSLGAVVLGNDVEVGSCTAIDRGTLAHTRVGNGTKIDNQVQIGHNVVIGENCLICGSVGLAGSVTVGDRVTLAARSGAADHVKIGDDAILMAASQLGGNLPSKAIYLGFPAAPREKYMEQIMHTARLKNAFQRISDLEAKVNAFANGLEKNEKTV